MNKIIIALGLALASSTAALAQSSALDVVGQQFSVTAPAVDYEATAQNLGVEAVQNRGNLGDGSPMVGGATFGSVAIETGYLPAPRLGGNS
jgi:hypothetical protein